MNPRARHGDAQGLLTAPESSTYYHFQSTHQNRHQKITHMYIVLFYLLCICLRAKQYFNSYLSEYLFLFKNFHRHYVWHIVKYNWQLMTKNAALCSGRFMFRIYFNFENNCLILHFIYSSIFVYIKDLAGVLNAKAHFDLYWFDHFNITRPPQTTVCDLITQSHKTRHKWSILHVVLCLIRGHIDILYSDVSN